jgi:hypothetical protein
VPRPIRYMPREGALFEITDRTIQGRLLLRPSAELNSMILGSLGRALAVNPEVSLYDFIFASNHYHLTVSAMAFGSISRFLNHLNSNVARMAGRLHGWRDHFWAGRFHAIPILDDDALLARLRYHLSHGCKEGLVMRPEDWAGVSCLPALLEGKELEGVWIDHTSRHLKSQAQSGADDRPRSEEVAIRYAIPLTPLPCWADLTEGERQAKVRAMVEDIAAETRERHEKAGTRPMGVRRVLQQNPHGLPKEVKRRKAPSCHAASAALRKTYRKLYRLFASLYREASERLRTGDRNVQFPEHCFPPAMAYQGAAGPP